MMDRIIRQITDHFVSKLPEGASHYHIEDLKDLDFPDFLVSRIHIELQRNLDESMILPDTDWANTQSEAVQRSWQQFLSAIHAEAKLPASYAKAVIETAVADIIEMLTAPRQKITDILFGGEEVLTAGELDERSELLVVYPHFAKVLTGYMRRKTRDELSRSRCKKIVAQVDDKITRQYTPLQWAQMLDPLFTLGGGKVNTSLLRLFFEDRQMHRTAGKFDAMDETIARAEFVEGLSKPELWDQEDYREGQPENSDKEEPIDIEKHADLDDISIEYENIGENHPSYEKPVSENEKVDKSRKEMDQSNGKTGEVKVEAGEGEGGNSESEHDEPEEPGQREPEEFQPEIKGQHQELRTGREEPEPSVENHDKEKKSGPEEPESSVENYDEDEKPGLEKQEEPYSLNAFFAESEGNEESDDLSDTYYSAAADGAEDDTMSAGQEEESASQPIWMRFRNQNDSERDSEEEIMPRFVEIEDEQGRWSENLARESSKESQTANADYQFKELKERLSNERGYFVDELFNGSGQAYEESLEKIAKENTWKKASKLIEQDIFKRNNVNIFSAVAVNFIDRLQDFFLEKQNRN